MRLSTTSTFTKEAKEYIKTTTSKVILIDGQQLCRLMIEFNLGVSVKRSIEIKRIDKDFFDVDE